MCSRSCKYIIQIGTQILSALGILNFRHDFSIKRNISQTSSHSKYYTVCHFLKFFKF